MRRFPLRGSYLGTLHFSIQGSSVDNSDTLRARETSFAFMTFTNHSLDDGSAHISAFAIELCSHLSVPNSSTDAHLQWQLEAFDWTALIEHIVEFPSLALIEVWCARKELLVEFVVKWKTVLTPVANLLAIYHCVQQFDIGTGFDRWQRLDWETLQPMGQPTYVHQDRSHMPLLTTMWSSRLTMLSQSQEI